MLELLHKNLFVYKLVYFVKEKYELHCSINSYIGFEFFGIVIFTPFAMFVLHKDMFHIAGLAIIVSIIAMLWNLIYNYIFDIIERKAGMCRSKRGVIINGITCHSF